MKLNFTFKHIDRSEALEKHASDTINGCARFLLKEGLGHVIFSKQQHGFCAEISINTKERHFRAAGFHEDPYHAVDAMVEKLERQILKVRRQVQHYKTKRLSKEGRLKEMNDRFEVVQRYKKAA